MPTWRRLLLMAFLVAIWHPLQAQSGRSTVRGRVLDASSAPILGAEITVIKAGQVSSQSIVSERHCDQNGCAHGDWLSEKGNDGGGKNANRCL